MIRINQLKIKTDHTKADLKKKAAGLLRVPVQEIKEIKIIRQSIDARKKPDIFYSYTADVTVAEEEKILRRAKGNPQISKAEIISYRFPDPGKKTMYHRPVIVGMGPAGLFCGYYLALHGYRPILLERGKCVEERLKDVENFWRTGTLDPESNVQFGEGGAGTFSDGKLNTLVKDKDGRNREILETLVKFGAEENICYEAKPHIGTDVLCNVVCNMRREIIALGGEVRFESPVTELKITDNKITGVIINGNEELDCEQLVLAVGHSARDTFVMLHQKRIPMEAKAFAVGLRVEHPQSMINESQYGRKETGSLGAAPYKVTAKTLSGRNVYSFCMCPGGYVVNASSEPGGTAVNGMSYSGRGGSNANSAIIVSVTPEDFPDSDPLAGVEFQRTLEKRAYDLGRGKIPVQRYGTFKEAVESKAATDITDFGIEPHQPFLEKMQTGTSSVPDIHTGIDTMPDSELKPQCKGSFYWTDVSDILPKECNEAFVEGMEAFGRQIRGFNRADAILLGVESRTSSPVRINRDETMQSKVRGLYPCGEGAGYAGGIISAAMDGLRVAEAVAGEFCNSSADEISRK